MKHLSGITLVMVAGDYIAPARQAVLDVLERFSFDALLLFANEELGVARHETLLTSVTSHEHAAMIVTYEAYPLIETERAIFIHWDGHPINPDMWSDDFRAFDFIGAVWPWFREHSVGNTGCSMRSRKLMRALYEDPHLTTKEPEDITLCRDQRPYLEEVHGIRFADEETATRFAVEHWAIGARAFGFHGVWNWLDHFSDEQIRQRLLKLAPKQWAASQIDTMMYRAICMGRRELYLWMGKTRAKVTAGT